MRYELVRVEADGEELVAQGTRAAMERDKDYLLSDFQEGGEYEGQPLPDYRVQPAQ
jgi:hypothetical protein